MTDKGLQRRFDNIDDTVNDIETAVKSLQKRKNKLEEYREHIKVVAKHSAPQAKSLYESLGVEELRDEIEQLKEN